MNIVCHTCSVNESEPSFEATRRYYFYFNLRLIRITFFLRLYLILSLTPGHFIHSDSVRSYLLKCADIFPIAVIPNIYRLLKN